jgi:hypothetical protein
VRDQVDIDATSLLARQGEVLGSGLTTRTLRWPRPGVRRERLRPADRNALRRVGSLSAGKASVRSRSGCGTARG